MKEWTIKALDLLRASLEPQRHDLNELDWKTELSSNKRRLTEHLSAFANHPGGGFLVYGVHPSGTPQGLPEQEVLTTINQLANHGRQALEPPPELDHAVEEYL